jgi:hypothetical protein
MGSPIEDVMRFNRTAALAAIAAIALPAAAAAQTGPAWAATHIPADVLALTCAPSAVYEMPAVPLRITGGQSLEVRESAGPGELVTVNAGRANGMQVGQEFFVRRITKDRDQIVSRATPGTVQTAGWIRIYAIEEEMSLATIVHACDTVLVGDYLEPFALPVAVPRGEKKGKPERDNYARVLPSRDRRGTYATGDFIVIDRGKDHGITPGSQFVVYHDKKKAGNFLYEVAEAVAVDVRENSSTLSVTFSRNAVSVNDYVAMRK